MEFRYEKYQPKSAGMKMILKSPASLALVSAKAARVAQKANSMYGASSYKVHAKMGAERAHAFVYTGDRYAMRSNAKHNTLQKAMGK